MSEASATATRVDDAEDSLGTQSPVVVTQDTEERSTRGERGRGDDAAARTTKRGRPEHNVWLHFKKLPNGVKKAHPDCECTLCRLRLNNGKPNGNLKKHLLEQCPEITPAQKVAVKRMFSLPVDGAPTADASQAQRQATCAHQFANEREFQLCYARQVFVHNLPLSLVENTLWRQMFETACPGYALPSREQLSSELLDAVYEEVQDAARVRQVAAVSRSDKLAYISSNQQFIRNSMLGLTDDQVAPEDEIQ